MKLLGTVILACALAALPIAFMQRRAQEAKLMGTAKVIDGDSLEIAGQRVRLAYVDAPEWLQTCKASQGGLWPCGERSAQALGSIIGNEIVSCRPVDRDRYERVVAICHVGEIDIGQAMVSQGMATAYRRYGDRYERDEQAAKEQKLGLWSGHFVEPELWRMQKRGSHR